MTPAVVCPGSFDPVTFGHLDVFRRAARNFPRVVVAVLENPGKQSTFTVEERIRFVEEEVMELGNVEVDRFTGLLVDFCRFRGIELVCKGVRGVGDFEYEQRMAEMNRRLGGVETVLLPSDPRHAHLSSSLVREIARYGGELAGAVPASVERALRERNRATSSLRRGSHEPGGPDRGPG